MSFIDKNIAVIVLCFLALVNGVKGVWSKLTYPFAYPFYNYCQKHDNFFSKILFWYWDDMQPPEGPKWYQEQKCKCQCKMVNSIKLFICAYRWSAWRNPMYNVNYYLLSNNSKIVYIEKSFGEYKKEHKLRMRNGDRGSQLVWYKTSKGQRRFLFSCAYLIFNKIPFTFYIGWNVSEVGRYTMAMKFSGN